MRVRQLFSLHHFTGKETASYRDGITSSDHLAESRFNEGGVQGKFSERRISNVDAFLLVLNRKIKPRAEERIFRHVEENMEKATFMR